MVKLHMDQTGNVNFTHVTLTASTAISATVHFIHVEIQQPEWNGLKARVFGTVQIAIGCMKSKQLNT